MKIKISQKRKTRIEMLPLIDIVFLLLVFFIYAMLSMAVHRGMTVDLPVSATAAPEKEQVLSVTVKLSPAGMVEYFVDEEPVELAGMTDFLKDKLKGRAASAPEPGVLLFADKQIDYQQLFEVLDRINRAGLSRISLQADVES